MVVIVVFVCDKTMLGFSVGFFSMIFVFLSSTVLVISMFFIELVVPWFSRFVPSFGSDSPAPWMSAGSFSTAIFGSLICVSCASAVGFSPSAV